MATAAQRVKVGMGQEVRGIDFSLVPGRTSRVSGTVVTASGAPVVGESVNLSVDFSGPDGAFDLSVDQRRANGLRWHVHDRERPVG